MAKRIYEKFTDTFWEFLQFCYILVVNSRGMTVGTTWSRKKQNNVRTGVFCFLFIYMISIYNQNLYLDKDYFKYHSLVFGVVLLGIIAFSKKENIKEHRWKSSIAKSFLMFCLWICVSDFIVNKRFQFVGIMLICIVGLFFFAWQYMEYPDDIFYNIFHALELIAAGGMIYNMIFRLKFDGLLYNGYMSSASDFGIFSSFLFLIFFIEIYESCRKQDYGKKMLFFVCGLIISILQTLMSGKEIAIFYEFFVIVAMLIWWLILGNKRLFVIDKKRMLGYLLLAGFFGCIYYFAVKNIPWNLQTMVQYKREKFETNKDPAVISVLASSGIGVYQNVQFHEMSQRILIWKEYLKEINLFGHEIPNLQVFGKRNQVQNQILQIIYQYGVIAAISYAAMFFETGKKVIKRFREAGEDIKGMDLLSVGVFLYWLIIGFCGNVEYPYYQPVWLMIYLIIGRCIITERLTEKS